jgi:hypothetical protein
MISDTSRREFIKLSGMLVVGVAAAGREVLAQAAGPYQDLDFRQLDSWIVIRQDNTATFYVGKTDPGRAPAPRSARSCRTSSTWPTTPRAW